MRKIIFTVFEYVILGFTLMCVIGLFLLGRDWFTATFALQWGVKREVIVLIFLAGGGVVGLCVGIHQRNVERIQHMRNAFCRRFKDDNCKGCPVRKRIGHFCSCGNYVTDNPKSIEKMYKEMIEQEERENEI